MSEEVRVFIDEDGAGAPRPHSNDDAASAPLAAALAETQRELAYRRIEVAQARADQMESAFHAERAAADQAQRDFQAALDNGDGAAMAAAQRRVAASEARSIRLEEAVHSFKAQAATPLPPADPVEAFISGRSHKTAAWLRAHPDHARAVALATAGRATPEQQRLAAKINAADSDALAEGYARDSQEYFNHVERYVGLRDGGGGRRPSAQPDMSGVRKYDPNTHVIDSRTVFLTEGESKQAVDGTLVWNVGPQKGMPIGLQEMARRKKAMIAEGRYRQLEG